MKLRSCIESNLKKKLLKRGYAALAAPLVLLLCSGLFAQAELLEYLRLFLLIVCFSAIGIGLRPYKHLCRLETTPDVLFLEGNTDENETLSYLQNNRIKWTILINTLDSATFFRNKYAYGIRLKIKGKKEYLELPYFSEQSCRCLQELAG